MTQISKSQANRQIKGMKEWLKSLGEDSIVFSMLSIKKITTFHKITQPTNKSCVLSINRTTSWDSSLVLDPWWKGLGLTQISCCDRPSFIARQPDRDRYVLLFRIASQEVKGVWIKFKLNINSKRKGVSKLHIATVKSKSFLNDCLFLLIYFARGVETYFVYRSKLWTPEQWRAQKQSSIAWRGRRRGRAGDRRKAHESWCGIADLHTMTFHHLIFCSEIPHEPSPINIW